MKKTGLVLQARMGSTRLPGKMTASFFKDKGVFEIIVERILEKFEASDVILATSSHKRDDVLEEIAAKYGVSTYRGSEDDVLQRFIGAAESKSYTDVIRICADNPFLDINALLELKYNHENSNADYTAFCLKDGTPSIRTHFGFWGEGVSLRALQKANELTQDTFYHEHVTNYIYGHPKAFSFKWLSIPSQLEAYKQSLRFTLDTPGDFERLKGMFKAWQETNMTTNELLTLALDNKELIEGMKQEIIKQSK